MLRACAQMFALMIALPVVVTGTVRPVAAHPHIFIDTGFELVTDADDALTHIRVTWAYDEYYSLLITEDLGVDADYDGVLTDQDQQALTGFDMNWSVEFNGDLVATLDGVPLILSRPVEPTATLQSGRIITTHLRAVEGKPVLAGRALSLKPYDPEFYSAYEVSLPVTLSKDQPGGCLIEKIAPDNDTTMQVLQDRFAKLGPDENPEQAGLPLIGAKLATEVRISCAGS